MVIIAFGNLVLYIIIGNILVLQSKDAVDDKIKRSIHQLKFLLPPDEELVDGSLNYKRFCCFKVFIRSAILFNHIQFQLPYKH